MQLEDLPLSFPVVGLLIYCLGYYLSWLSAPKPPVPRSTLKIAKLRGRFCWCRKGSF